MSLQHEVLERYLEVYRKPTLKFISENTGIQITRVFRLLNGSEMKLHEYQAFLNSLNEKNNRYAKEDEIFKTVREILFLLPEETIEECHQYLKRKIQLRHLFTHKKTDFIKKGGV